MKEYRTLNLTVSPDNDSGMRVEGYAAVFNQRTLIWESEWSGYKYFESIAPGAFENADMADVILRYNHDDSAYILARTTNNTLSLAVDEKGLKISAELADTTAGRDIYALIKRQDISKMSFAFTVDSDQIESDATAKTQLRTILKFDTIFDVSPVDFPAYDGTDIQARRKSAFADIERQEKELYLRKKLILCTY